jgi:hypothetical protein
VEGDAEVQRELASELGLPTPVGPGEQERPDRLAGAADAGTGQLDRGDHGLDGLVLPEDDVPQILLEVAELVGVLGGHLLRRDARDARDRVLHVGDLDRRPFREVHGRTDLVHHVDRLVRELAVRDVPARELHGLLERLVRVRQLVVLFVLGLEALQDEHRVVDRGLHDLDRLEAARERLVLAERLAVVLVGRGPDAPQRAGGEGWFEQVRRVHRAAARGAGADDDVDLVDEQDGFGVVFERLDHPFQPIFEVAAVAGPAIKAPMSSA